jgi:hypothetical protein
MDRQSTYDDVNLVLKLYELRREAKLRQAREWFGKSFKASTMEQFLELCPLGSDNNAYVRMVVSYWEMVASFITGGVLNEELFFQSGGELLFAFEKIRDLLPNMRQAFQSPFYLKNMETVATDFIQWMEKRAPGSYAAFQARVRGA